MLAAFQPIWMLVVIGLVARRWGLVPEQASKVLGQFVFNVAMPAAIVGALARRGDWAGHDVWGVASFAASTVTTMGLGWWFARRHEPAQRMVLSMAGGYVNSANLGIPVALQLFGESTFAIHITLFQVLVCTPVVLLVLDRYSAGGQKLSAWRVVTLPVRNPIVLAAAVGLVVPWAQQILGVWLPTNVWGSVDLLGQAAVPTALVALGASLGDRVSDVSERAAGPRDVVVAVVLKIVAQPLVAGGCAWVCGLPLEYVLMVVVCAGLPTAQNTFIFAQQYGVAERAASLTVLWSTAASLVSLATVVAIFG